MIHHPDHLLGVAMRDITIQEASECIKRTLPRCTPDIWFLTRFKDYVNNNTEVDDMEEDEFFDSFLPCALWAFTEAMYSTIMPVTRFGECAPLA